jgi:hypothetical protein
MEESLDIFKELDQSVDPNIRKEWEGQERLAMKFWGNYLNVYNVNKEKGQLLISTINQSTLLLMLQCSSEKLHSSLCCQLKHLPQQSSHNHIVAADWCST